MNHTDPSVLPSGFRTGTNDARILACAANLAAEGKRVTLVRGHSAARQGRRGGSPADEYHAQDVVTSGWTGMTELTSPPRTSTRSSPREIDLADARNLPCHTGIRLLGGTSHALGRVNADKRVQLVRGDREVFGLRGRSAEQRVALDLLLDESVGIVSLGGKAGTGKSALALCAGPGGRPRAPRPAQGRGFPPAVRRRRPGARLPARQRERQDGSLGPGRLRHPRGLASPAVLEEVQSRGMLEVLPLTHIRGRSLHDSFVIVDEAQSLSATSC